MRSLFEMGFRNAFRPVIGQDDNGGIITSLDQEPSETTSPWGEAGAPVTSLGPSTPESTSPWGAAGAPVTSLPSGTTYGGGGGGGGGTAAPAAKSGTAAQNQGPDYGKIASQAITAAGAGYGAYSKEQTAKIQAETNAQKAAAAAKAGIPGAAAAPASGISGNTLFLVGGALAVVVIAATTLR